MYHVYVYRQCIPSIKTTHSAVETAKRVSLNVPIYNGQQKQYLLLENYWIGTRPSVSLCEHSQSVTRGSKKEGHGVVVREKNTLFSFWGGG